MRGCLNVSGSEFWFKGESVKSMSECQYDC